MEGICMNRKPRLVRDAFPLAEACERLGGVTYPTLKSWINRGDLKAYRMGRRWFVSAEAIREFIARKEGRA
jgi:excisionase family DNA binding protein